jgi:uncharacterized protein (DUF1778 family)
MTANRDARKAARTRRSERLDVRVSADERDLFEEAATLSGRTVADFVRETATTSARMLLADRTRFTVEPERWAAFADAIDREPRYLPRLGAFLAEPSVLDKPSALPRPR